MIYGIFGHNIIGKYLYFIVFFTIYGLKINHFRPFCHLLHSLPQARSTSNQKIIFIFNRHFCAAAIASLASVIGINRRISRILNF